jgi:myb proto-oncogene protein
LKKLHEDLGISKWSEISRMMEEVYGVEGRNGKQCRERYHNHLKNGINKDKWTES